MQRLLRVGCALSVVCAAVLVTVLVIYGERVFRQYNLWYHPHDAVPADSAALRVLWYGNSHTSRHRVPAQVQTLSEERGDGPIHVSWRWVEGLDHTIELLEEDLDDSWDVVVVQAHSWDVNRADFLRLHDRLEKVRVWVDAAGARLILYEPWRYRASGREPGADPSFQQRIDTIYCAAEAAGAEVAFVGALFERALEPPVSGDGNHTTASGARIASEVVESTLNRRSPRLEGLVEIDTLPEGRSHDCSKDPQVRSRRNNRTYNRGARAVLLSRVESLASRTTTQLTCVEVYGDDLVRRTRLALDGSITDGLRVRQPCGEHIEPLLSLQLSQRRPGAGEPTPLESTFEHGGLTFTTERVSSPLSPDGQQTVQLAPGVVAVGDLVSGGCAPLAVNPDEAQGLADWLRTAHERAPETVWVGSVGPPLEPDAVATAMSDLEAYAAAWRETDDIDAAFARVDWPSECLTWHHLRPRELTTD